MFAGEAGLLLFRKVPQDFSHVRYAATDGEHDM